MNECCAERQLGRKVAGLCYHLREVGESFGWQKDSRWYANLADSLVMDKGVQGCVKLLEEVEYGQAQFLMGATWMYLREMKDAELRARRALNGRK